MSAQPFETDNPGEQPARHLELVIGGENGGGEVPRVYPDFDFGQLEVERFIKQKGAVSSAYDETRSSRLNYALRVVRQTCSESHPEFRDQPDKQVVKDRDKFFSQSDIIWAKDTSTGFEGLKEPRNKQDYESVFTEVYEELADLNHPYAQLLRQLNRQLKDLEGLQDKDNSRVQEVEIENLLDDLLTIAGGKQLLDRLQARSKQIREEKKALIKYRAVNFNLLYTLINAL